MPWPSSALYYSWHLSAKNDCQLPPIWQQLIVRTHNLNCLLQMTVTNGFKWNVFLKSVQRHFLLTPIIPIARHLSERERLIKLWFFLLPWPFSCWSYVSAEGFFTAPTFFFRVCQAGRSSSFMLFTSVQSLARVLRRSLVSSLFLLMVNNITDVLTTHASGLLRIVIISKQNPEPFNGAKSFPSRLRDVRCGIVITDDHIDVGNGFLFCLKVEKVIDICINEFHKLASRRRKPHLRHREQESIGAQGPPMTASRKIDIEKPLL